MLETNLEEPRKIGETKKMQEAEEMSKKPEIYLGWPHCQPGSSLYKKACSVRERRFQDAI